MVTVRANYKTVFEPKDVKFYCYSARLCLVCGREEHEMADMPKGMVF